MRIKVIKMGLDANNPTTQKLKPPKILLSGDLYSILFIVFFCAFIFTINSSQLNPHKSIHHLGVIDFFFFFWWLDTKPIMILTFETPHS